MADFLGNLLDRSFQVSTEVRPRTPALFESTTPGSATNDTAQETNGETRGASTLAQVPVQTEPWAPKFTTRTDWESEERNESVSSKIPLPLPPIERSQIESNYLAERLADLEQRLQQVGHESPASNLTPAKLTANISAGVVRPSGEEPNDVSAPVAPRFDIASSITLPNSRSGKDTDHWTDLAAQVRGLAAALPTAQEQTPLVNRSSAPVVAAPVIRSKRRELEAPTVTVTIGRIELRSPDAPPPPAPVRRKDGPSRVMSLEQYLQLRSQRELT